MTQVLMRDSKVPYPKFERDGRRQFDARASHARPTERATERAHTTTTTATTGNTATRSMIRGAFATTTKKMTATSASSTVNVRRVTLTTRGTKTARRVGAAVVPRSTADAMSSPAYDASAHEPLRSGLEGKALNAKTRTFPSMQEVLKNIPQECFVRDTGKSMAYAVVSTALTLGCGALAYAFLPLQAAYWPLWVAYAFVTGTVATGCWVVAHECGHGAFSDNKTLQDTVGYILHSLLLVPYFSWQRSHAVHHSRTNHVLEGETHVPARLGTEDANVVFKLRSLLGEGPFTALNLLGVFAFGWPVYLLTGASGGPVRGTTNHFLPFMGEQGKNALFPGKWAKKVWQSDIGVVAVLGALAAWAAHSGIATVMALYVGPYMITNFWLVLYTWLQHTDVDVPHFEGDEWNLVKGAFMTIDRPYGPVFDFLHHRIGSTHVAHHVNHTIPHYHAKKATEALASAYPDLYLYDPTPIATATWRVGSKCIAVVKKGDEWVFTDHELTPATA